MPVTDRPAALLACALALAAFLPAAPGLAQPLEVAAADLLAGCGAAARPSPAPAPKAASRAYVEYPGGNDDIRSADHPDAVQIDGGDGDDRIYLTDRPHAVMIDGGKGADTIVLCAAQALAVTIDLAGDSAIGRDAASDRLVVGPEVFLGVPPGFRRQVRIFGYSAGDDVITLVLPPGMDFDFAPNRSPMASAGPVDFTLVMADTTATPGADAFRIETAAEVGPVQAPEVDAPLSSYRRDISCAEAEALAPVAPEIAGWQNALYSPGPDILRIDAQSGIDDHMLLGGDDTAYLFTSQSVSLGSGADLAIVCAMDQLGQYIHLGENDVDGDTLVVETARLQGDSERTLHVFGVTNVNDRVVLRVPPELEVGFASGGRQATVGALRVELGFAQRSGMIGTPAVFVVERVSEPLREVETLDAPRDLAAIACPHPDAARPAAATTPAGGSASAQFGDGDDAAVVWGAPGRQDTVVTGWGDDTVYVFEPVDGSAVATGRGRDIVALCTMASLSFGIGLGDGSLLPDAEADAVILGPDAFLGVPDGLRRKISITGVTPENDRVQLRLPPGRSVDRIDVRADWMELAVGAVDVRIGFTRETRRDVATGEVLSVRSAAPFAAAGETAAAPEGAGAGGADAEEPRCADMPALSDWAVPVVRQNAGMDFHVYGDGAERIRVEATPEIRAVAAGGGGDVVFIVDPGENAALDLGPGADVALLCSMTELALSVLMGPHDAEPDRLILEAGAFGGIPEGQIRRIVVGNVVAGSDVVVIRPPRGVTAEFRSLLMGPGYVVGRTEIFAMPSDAGAGVDFRDLYRVE
ncbi:hypothetical protein [Roseivivax sp. CAU 1761]